METKQLRSDQSKILGNLKDYEVAARVRWQVRVEPGLLWIMLLLLLVLVSGLFYSHQQCQGLSGLRLEIKRELDELTRLKAELERGLSEWNTSTSRAKRQVKSSGGNGLFTKRKSRAGSSSSKGKKSKTKPAVQDHQGRAVHLERDIVFTETGGNGVVNYWRPQPWAGAGFAFDDVHLEDRNSSLVVPKTGLYLVYAQLCYAVTRENNSFEVKVMSEGRSRSESKVIAQCSAGTSSLADEVTCYTSVVQVLQAGDRVYLQQTQKNRHLLMNMGRSFMGVVKLFD